MLLLLLGCGTKEPERQPDLSSDDPAEQGPCGTLSAIAVDPQEYIEGGSQGGVHIWIDATIDTASSKESYVQLTLKLARDPSMNIGSGTSTEIPQDGQTQSIFVVLNPDWADYFEEELFIEGGFAGRCTGPTTMTSSTFGFEGGWGAVPTGDTATSR